MLIDFTVRNYRSIKNEVSLNMESNNKNIHPSSHVIPIENGRRHLYPFSAIYGANASGKSNVVKALYDLYYFVLSSHTYDKSYSISCYKPFRLDTESRNKPTMFQIELHVQRITYLYTVEFTEKTILLEELYFYPNSRKTLLFKREGSKVQYGKQFRGEKKAVEVNLLENRLLLSLFGNSTNKVLRPLYVDFIFSHQAHMDEPDLHIHFEMSSTNLMLQNNPKANKSKFLKFLSKADLSVEDIKLKNNEVKLPEEITKDNFVKILADMQKFRPQLAHQVFENNKKINKLEYFDLAGEESTGTQHFYAHFGSIIYALIFGSTLLIDEFNSNLHPLLCEFITSLFTNEKINENHAQLIIVTHDLHILDHSNIKREQVWFTEKNRYGATDLFSMEEFKEKNSIPDNTPFSKYYISGSLGAIPNIDSDSLEGMFSRIDIFGLREMITDIKASKK